jgi:hypothetical protein
LSIRSDRESGGRSKANGRDPHAELFVDLDELAPSHESASRRQLDRLSGMPAEWDHVTRPQFCEAGNRQVDSAEFDNQRQRNVRGA